MYKIDFTKTFKKEYKKFAKLGKNQKVDEIIMRLANGENLPSKNKDHALKGDYTGFRECHIEPNLLLVYKIYDDILVLSLLRLGSHSDIFKDK